MAAASIDYSALVKGLPPGAWVAISERSNKVLAYSADIQTVIDRAREQGENVPLIVKVPEQTVTLFL
jgi:hypothetical protein